MIYIYIYFCFFTYWVHYFIRFAALREIQKLRITNSKNRTIVSLNTFFSWAKCKLPISSTSFVNKRRKGITVLHRYHFSRIGCCIHILWIQVFTACKKHTYMYIKIQIMPKWIRDERKNEKGIKIERYDLKKLQQILEMHTFCP